MTLVIIYFLVLGPVRTPCSNPVSCTYREAHKTHLLKSTSVEIIIIVCVDSMTVKELKLMFRLIRNGKPSTLTRKIMPYHVGKFITNKGINLIISSIRFTRRTKKLPCNKLKLRRNKKH